MGRQQVKFNVRMDETLRQRLKAEAKRSVRSINGEIIHRLLESLKEVEQRDGPAA
jgi:predicted HicB family RNase H-like nuclease